MVFQEGNEDGKDTQFKPGQSGNLNGRPKGQRNLQTIIGDILEAKLNKHNAITGQAEEHPIVDHIGFKHAEQALEGDVQSTNLLFDRLEGKPKQTNELEIKTTMADIIGEIEAEIKK